MKPAITYREARVIRSAREVAEQCDMARARRTCSSRVSKVMPCSLQAMFWRRVPILLAWLRK